MIPKALGYCKPAVEKSTALRSWFAAALVQRLVNLARDMEVTVVADRSTRRA
jgi:hypothetical protein